MATLYIGEYVASTTSVIPIPVAPAIAEQTVAIGATSLQSAPFNGATGLVRLHSDIACSVAFGPNPVATAASGRLAAGLSEVFVVRPGMRVAVISNT